MDINYKKNISFNSWKKRIGIISSLFFLICGLLIWQIFDKTIIEHDKYKKMAENQHFITKELVSHRGKIIAQDRTSDKPAQLAINVEKFSVNVVPKNVKNKQEAAKKLASFLDMQTDDIFNQINNDKLYVPPIKRRIDKDLADKIANEKIQGVIITSEDARFYPQETLGCYILGFVNYDNEGKYGIEGFYNEQLKGKGGLVEGLKDTHGTMITTNIEQEVENGSDVVLTIDQNVQYKSEEIIKKAKDDCQGESASVVIVNPKTGAVIAMAGDTSFDPNNFNEVAKNNQSAFNNPIIANAWEPGSIMKPIIMAAAIDEGKVEPDTEQVFDSFVTVQGYEINTAEGKAFGRETMTNVLENSDNVGMVWIADQLGNDSMYKYLDKFGFGKKSNIDLIGESAGLLTDVKKWRDINRATMSFGQGITATPLQLAMAYSTLVNGGKLLRPYTVSEIVRPNGDEIKSETKIIEDKVIKSETSDKLKQMLVSVVEHGTGKKAKMDNYAVGGKTGTAQIANPNGGYQEEIYNHSFGGFFPADDPQFVIIVRIDKPKTALYAESTAVPVFNEMAKWLVQYYEIEPKDVRDGDGNLK